MKYFIRIISAPFLFALLLIANIYQSAESVIAWIKNGGWFKINENK